MPTVQVTEYYLPQVEYFNGLLSAEGGEHTLVVYRLGKRVKPEAIGNFLSTGLELVSLPKFD